MIINFTGIDLDETSDSGRDYDSDEMEDATDSDLEQMIDYRSESEVSVSHAKEYLELLEDRLDRRLRRVRKRQMKKARRCDKCGSFTQGHGNNKRGGGGGGGRGRRGGRPGRALAS